MSWTLFSHEGNQAMLLKVLDMTRVCLHRGLQRHYTHKRHHSLNSCLQTQRWLKQHDFCKNLNAIQISKSNYAIPIQPYLVYPPSCSVWTSRWWLLQQGTLGVKSNDVNGENKGRGLQIMWPLVRRAVPEPWLWAVLNDHIINNMLLGFDINVIQETNKKSHRFILGLTGLF